MATTVNVGQTVVLAIEYLDQNGKPMSPTPTPDSPPSWSQSNGEAESLTVAEDGMSATTKALASGTDTITLTLVVAGNSFTATLAVEVDAAAQTLTTIQIVPTVSS